MACDAALLELAEVAPQGVLGDPGEAADVLVRHALGLEVDRLHLLLHSGVGVMEAFVVQGVDLLGGKLDANHGDGLMEITGRSECCFNQSDQKPRPIASNLNSGPGRV